MRLKVGNLSFELSRATKTLVDEQDSKLLLISDPVNEVYIRLSPESVEYTIGRSLQGCVAGEFKEDFEQASTQLQA